MQEQTKNSIERGDELPLIPEWEAASLLNCSVSKLAQDRRLGSGIDFIRYGKWVFYSLKALRDHLRAHTHEVIAV
jgi:hypothetical protein